MGYYALSLAPGLINQSAFELLRQGIRGQWATETVHLKLDGPLGEDKVKTKCCELGAVCSGLRTLALIIFRKMMPKNISRTMRELNTSLDCLRTALQKLALADKKDFTEKIYFAVKGKGDLWYNFNERYE